MHIHPHINTHARAHTHTHTHTHKREREREREGKREYVCVHTYPPHMCILESISYMTHTVSTL